MEPIFIVGTPRSGTTLLRLILDSHPEIAITPESSFLFSTLSLWDGLYPCLTDKRSIEKFIKDLKKLPQVRNWLLDTCTADMLQKDKKINNLSSFIDAIFSNYAHSKGKKRWGDKTPKNLYAIDEIIKMFHFAKIVIVIRDCRDVAMSLNKAEFSKISYISAAKRWQRDANMTKKIIQKYDKQIYLLKYENLLENPNKTIISVLKFLDLPNDPDIMERYVRHEDDVVHTKSTLYRQPLNKNNIYKWKKYMSKRDIIDCEAIAKESMEYFGYEISTKNPTISPVKVFLYRVKDYFQLINNSKNMENYYVYGRLFIKRVFQKFII